MQKLARSKDKKRVFRRVAHLRNGVSKIHREFNHVDYLSKLSPEETTWLSRFNNEYLTNTFMYRDEDLHRCLPGCTETKCFCEKTALMRASWYRRNDVQGLGVAEMSPPKSSCGKMEEPIPVRLVRYDDPGRYTSEEENDGRYNYYTSNGFTEDALIEFIDRARKENTDE